MKTLRRLPAGISKSRWAAYVTAGAATALATTQATDAAIHYSGPVNEAFRPGEDKSENFPLDQAGDSFQMNHSSWGFVGFHVSGIEGAAFRGPPAFDYYYVSRLQSGEKISVGNFTQNGAQFGTLIFGTGFPFPFKQWRQPGVGFVGFTFDGGAGRQYGWVRIRTYGSRNGNAFQVLDYAYADPGEAIKAGQTSSESRAPVRASLGLLALGAAGLVALREKRGPGTAPAS